MATATPAREDIDALAALTKLIVDAAAITRFLAHRWNVPAIADSLDGIGAHDPSSSSPSLPLKPQRAQSGFGNSSVGSTANAPGPGPGAPPPPPSSEYRMIPVVSARGTTYHAIPEHHVATLYQRRPPPTQQQQQQARPTSSTSPTQARAPIPIRAKREDADGADTMMLDHDEEVDALGEMDPELDAEGEDELGDDIRSHHQQHQHQPYQTQTQHAQRNNSNQHGQMRILANHRAPQPLDGTGAGGERDREERGLNRYMSAPSLGSQMSHHHREGQYLQNQDPHPPPASSNQNQNPGRALSSTALAPPTHTAASSSSSSASNPSSSQPGAKPTTGTGTHSRRGLVPLAERHCSECGKPGRFKDGRSVEKWGPGPEGPGTVCDKCRKKMKRLDRKGAQTQVPSQGPVIVQQQQQQRQSPPDPTANVPSASISPHTHTHASLSPTITTANGTKDVTMARYDPARTDYRTYPPPGLNDTPSNARSMSQSNFHSRKGMDELGVLVEAADAMPSRSGSSGTVTPSATAASASGPVSSSSFHYPAPPPQSRARGPDEVDADGDVELDDRDADGDGSGDGEGEEEEEDDLIAAWEGSGSNPGAPAGRGGGEREWANQDQAHNHPTAYNGPHPHQQHQHPQMHHPQQHRGIPVSDIRSSSSMDTILPPTRGTTASPANGFGGFSFGGSQTPRTQSQVQMGFQNHSSSHPAKRAKMDDYGRGGSRAGSDAGTTSAVARSGPAKEKSRKRATPSFSPSPPGSPRPRQHTEAAPAHSAGYSYPSYANGHRSPPVQPPPWARSAPVPGERASRPSIRSVSPPAAAPAAPRPRTNRPSLTAMNLSSPEADDFKPNNFPSTPPTHTLSTGSILGKRPRPSSSSLAGDDDVHLDLGDGGLDDELLEAVSGSGAGAQSNGRYYGRPTGMRTSDSVSSGSGSRSPSPVSMHMGGSTSGVRMKPASSLRAVVGVAD